jgi:hypothetical protein
MREVGTRSSTFRIVFLLAFCLILFLRVEPVRAGRTALLQGTVKDAFGNLLAEVDVLVLPERPGSGSPVASAQTDPNGRFVIEGLQPGVYRLAALKAGYMSFLGRVNTWLKDTLTLVLNPAPSLDGMEASESEDDSAWILRVPERSLLRDTGAVDLLAAGGRYPADRAAAPSTDAARVEFEQRFAYSPHEASRDATGVQASQTRLRLGAPIGRRGSFRFEGSRERDDGLDSGQAIASAIGSDVYSAGLGFRLEAGPDVRLDVNAGYRYRELDPGREVLADRRGERASQRQWGYDATWKAHLAPLMDLEAGLDFRESLFTRPEGQYETSPELSRTFAARASLGSVPSRNHELRLDAAVQRVDWPLVDPREATIVAGEDLGFTPGWSLALGAEDRWRLSTPVAVVYGVSVRKHEDPTQVSSLAPRLGGEWNGSGLRARMVVSYDLAESDHSSLGYEGVIEGRMPFGLIVHGAVSYEPRAMGATQATGVRGEDLAPYLVLGGEALRRQQVLGLERESGLVRVRVEFARGVIAGAVLGDPLTSVSLLLTPERNLAYRSGRVVMRVVPSATDISIGYRDVDDLAAAGAGLDSSLAYRYFDLRLAQDLARLDAKSMCWRLLMAARYAPSTVDSPAGGEIAPVSVRRDPLERLTLGVSMVF